MPRVHTQKARKAIYARGFRVEDPNTKSGKRLDRSIPADENDYKIVEAGQTYYKWKFRYGGWRISTKYPRQSQLTQSDYLSRIYGFSESIEDFGDFNLDDINTFLEDLKNEVSELADETEEKRENMPENLYYSPTAEMLEERAQAVRDFESELESLDVEEFDLDEKKLEIEEEDPDLEPHEVAIKAEEAEIEHYQEWFENNVSGLEVSG